MRLFSFIDDILINAINIKEKIFLKFFKEFKFQYTYSELHAHEVMLKDKVRIDAYRKAIFEKIKKGDLVLDLGTGTGIFAFYACKAGARKVYAVDYSKIIKLAQKIAIKNNLRNIEFIRTDIKNLDIPKVDCIISELIGFFIINEGMINKINLGKKFLKKNGKIIPTRVDLYIMPIESYDFGSGLLKKLFNIDYFDIKDEYKKSKVVIFTKKSKALSKPLLIFSFDMKNLSSNQIQIENQFKIIKNGELHGFLGFFKIYLTDKIVINTSPFHPQTHWNQFFLPTKTERVSKGDIIKLSLCSVEHNTDWRWKYEKIK